MGSSASKDSHLPQRPLSEPAGRGSLRKGSTANNNNVLQHRGKGTSVASTLENTVYEHVFHVTTGQTTGDDLPETSVLLAETAKKAGTPALLTHTNIEEAVFERLMLRNPGSKLVSTVPGSPSHAPPALLKAAPVAEPLALKYLYHCFVRWRAVKEDPKFAGASKELAKSENVIFQNATLCLQQPKLFQKQNVYAQFIDLCIDAGVNLLDTKSKIYEFIMKLVERMDQQPGAVMECLVPVLKMIRTKFTTEFKLSHANEISQYTSVVRLFTCSETLAKVFMEFNAPVDWGVGGSYERTLLGAMFALNPCPRGAEVPCEFFADNAAEQSTHDLHKTIMFIWQRLYTICEDINRILKTIIKLSPGLRHSVLNWLGRCLHANRGKVDLWSAHETEVFQKDFCSDGFSLNMCHVLLHLCTPFSTPGSPMLLKVKPSYTRAAPATDQQAEELCVHSRGLEDERTLAPYTEERQLPPEKCYTFICECFFLTHQALHIAYSMVYKLYKLNSSIVRLKRLLELLKETHTRRVIALVKMQLNREFCWYYNMKAALTEYSFTKMCLSFHVATATWLVQVASRDDVKDFPDVTLPLPVEIPKSLSSIPEFVITNYTMFVSSLEIFGGMDLLAGDRAILDHMMTLVLVFMGSPKRLADSDARAKLSEALDALLPRQNDDGSYNTSKTSGNVDAMFREHRLIGHLAGTVLNVFVSIEMTGQSVDDERKFNYRKSMHKLLQYMWKIPLHKQAIKGLASTAMKEIENTEPPLFLRFINLLINDAIFLLDEALDHMKQIKDLELERDTGKWDGLSAEAARDKETGLRHLGMMGRYRNVMANYTIYTLEILSREIRDIFCHSLMVDRVAGLLNYFLEHLVGPKQKEYKVRDRREYEFRPEQIVSDISHIYVYLGTSDTFCKAVLGETRSFSENLFQQATTVLEKIGVQAEFLVKFVELNDKLKGLEREAHHEEEMLADAPDEFLDPIMGTLMADPVTLPDSKTNMDRNVIARHLLSDQRDPFTNMPLSMDRVTPNTDLKQRINHWKAEQLKKT
ncbi:ubiquitin conjugation factor E4 A-like isoform X2 [Mya arenaria]|uniref:ubiquitin conjugation factor E4 A-like isoform X2 n=1 Tax=Mya arenaria TaxID=6604 RepID=UPI0022E4AE41|nr:ubiquitin conjugation factor E4 A-like isoform X2 [Mya arenaria]